MLIGERIRDLRQQRGYSQGDLEGISGLLRCYISRVEHGHTVPSLNTLEKIATALSVPLYQLFYDGDAPSLDKLTPRPTLEEMAGPETGDGATDSLAEQLRNLLAGMSRGDRNLLLHMAEKMARR